MGKRRIVGLALPALFIASALAPTSATGAILAVPQTPTNVTTGLTLP